MERCYQGLRRRLLLLSVLLLSASAAYAQFEVRGVVRAADDNSLLPGVNIVEVGTMNGTTTDANGNFVLTVSSPQATLRFSFVGYETLDVPLNGRNYLEVLLQPTVAQLGEVVVTALGIEREARAVGYAISQVSAQDLVTGTETNFGNLLQGKVAGLQINPTAGGPGSSTRIVIRGVSSLTGDNQPLIVVDGVPIDNSTIGSAGMWGGFDGGDGISSLNPEDIESISVLKGAAAAALYGTRARNGVILINTRSGKGRRGLNVEFSTTLTAEEGLVGFSDYQNTYGQGSQGKKPATQAEALQFGLSSWGAKLDGSPVIQFDGVARPYRAVNRRLEDFYRTGLSARNTLSIYGGQENAAVYFSVTQLNAQSIVPGSGLQRTSLTLRGTATLGRFTVDAKANYVNELADDRARLSDSPGNANWTIAFLPPNVDPNTLKPGYTEEGTELQFSDNIYATNPWWVVNRFQSDDDKDRLIGALDVEYRLTDWLAIEGRTGLDWYTLRRRSVTPWGTAYRPGGDLSENEWRVLESNTDVLLKARHQLTTSLGRLDLNAYGGGSVRWRQTEMLGAFGSEFKVPGLITISNTSNQSPQYDFSEKQINSLYGALEIGYNDYLFLNLTARNDWSSTLPPDNNSYFYPSVSASFVFSDVLPVPSWLSFGKLRAAWAQVGSDTDPYMLNLTYVLDNTSHLGQPLGYIGQNSVPLFNLKPTTTTETELGVNLEFLNNRLGLDLTWYRRETTDQILSTSISEASGFGERVINAGALRNQGVELLLRGTPLQTSQMFWNLSVNFAKNISKVLALAGEQTVLVLDQSRTQTAWITAEVGKPYGTIWGYRYLRDDQGRIVHDDSGLPMRDPERVVLGRGTPDWTAGFLSELGYKNLNVSLLIDVKWGGQLFSATNAYAYSVGLHKNTLNGRAECDAVADPTTGYPATGCMVGEGVNQQGQPNTVKVLPQAYYGRIAGQITEEFVYDANFIKLRELRVAYRIPDRWLLRTPLRSLTVALVGRNLAYLYNTVPNVDPESSYNNGNAQGLELAGVPQTRSLGLSINARF
ncbi:SusC/RagA family TonB-linked outer membrane protein [Rhodothermus marinus]|uniref:SusC/RagA family TonB-linked outer membrane protein n=1 Tax=Rhodothermus marinus TaxID=29549 RepID=UPI0037CBDDAB